LAPVIELVGRQQGLISFLLTLIGISPITEFTVTRDEVCFNSTSLFGKRNQAVPLRAVCSVAAGIRKPISYLIFAFLFLVGGVIGSFQGLWRDGFFTSLGLLVFTLAMTAFLIWLYAINKRFFVSIHAQSGPPIMLSFKPNVIEGVPLDLEGALRMVKVVREHVLASSALHSSGSGAPSPPPFSYAPAKAKPHDGDASSAPPPFSNGIQGIAVATYPEPETLLQKARDLIKNAQRQEAIVVLRDIVTRFPETQEATVAKSTLERAGIHSR
jgi:hypothetical protein